MCSKLAWRREACRTYAPFKALDLLDIIEHVTPVACALQRGCDGVFLEFGGQILQRQLHSFQALTLNSDLKQH